MSIDEDKKYEEEKTMANTENLFDLFGEGQDTAIPTEKGKLITFPGG